MSEKEQEKGREEENCHKIRHGGRAGGKLGTMVARKVH